MPKRNPQKPCVPDPPLWSHRLYLKLDKKDIAYLRFLLESEDNLAFMSVMDKYSSVLKLTYSPGQQQEIQEFIQDLAQELQFRLLDCPESRFTVLQEE